VLTVLQPLTSCSHHGPAKYSLQDIRICAHRTFSLCCRRRMGHATVVLSFVLCHFWSVVAPMRSSQGGIDSIRSQQWMYLEATIHLLRSIRLSTFLSTVLSLQCLVQSLGRWIGFGVQAKRQNELWLIAQWEELYSITRMPCHCPGTEKKLLYQCALPFCAAFILLGYYICSCTEATLKALLLHEDAAGQKCSKKNWTDSIFLLCLSNISTPS